MATEDVLNLAKCNSILLFALFSSSFGDFRGGLFTKSDDKDISNSFLFIYPIFCGINKQLCKSNT